MNEEMGPSDTEQERPCALKWFIKYGIDLVICGVLGVIAFIIPDMIFDTSFPLHSDEYPGSYQTITFTNINNSSDTFTSTFFVKNPINDRQFIHDAAVSGTMLGVYNSAVPTIYAALFIYIYFYRILKWNGKYLYYELISIAYAYLIAMGLVFWFSRLVKYFCAWPRPDFWDRCQPLFEYSVDYSAATSEMTFIECDYTQFEYYEDIDDFVKAYQAFPSGHTSYMFTAACILAYFTIGKLSHPYYTTEKLLYPKFSSDNKVAALVGAKWRPKEIDGEKNTEGVYYYVFDLTLLIGFVLSTWGVWGSLWVAISRVDDHRHFPTDLVSGALIGMMCAMFGYLTQYEWGLPFSNRVLRLMNDDYEYYVKRRRVVSTTETKYAMDGRPPESDGTDIVTGSGGTVN